MEGIITVPILLKSAPSEMKIPFQETSFNEDNSDDKDYPVFVLKQ